MTESIDFNQILTTYLIPWAKNIGLAAIILLAGRFAAGIAVGVLRRVLVNAKLDSTLVNFICSISGWTLLFVVILMALKQLGVDTTSLIALLGAAGLAVGLSLRNSLQNFAAGVMLITFRPFKEGDFIEAGGVSGNVEDIQIFSTTLVTADNRQVIIPNGTIYSGVITNFSAKAKRRIDLVFGIGYEDDIRKAKEIIEGIAGSDTRVLKNPAPAVSVSSLGASSVNLEARLWVNTPDYEPVKFDVTEKVKLAFDAGGISLPYPQMDVHLGRKDGEDESDKAQDN